MEYLNSATKKIHRERKYCVLMGDFNIDLLKYDQHQVTDDFINTLGAYFSNLIFFQPSHITEHNATLIDNIFLTLVTTFL